MATKKYEVLKAITLPGGIATDEDGKTIGACIMEKGTINLDPEHSATVSLLANECIREKGVKAAAERVVGRTGRQSR